MKNINLLYLLFMISAFNSCKKNAENKPTNIVSGKLKSTVKTVENKRSAYIVTVEYDLSNRVTHFNEWFEDSSFTPIMISSAKYTSYGYQTINQFPSKKITTHQSGQVDSSLFYYDIFNRLAKEDFYAYNSLPKKTQYYYINPNLMILHDSVYSTGSFYYSGMDSVFLDNNKSITKWNGYDHYGFNTTTYTTNYNNTKNPFYELNIFKYLYSVGDLEVGYNSPHNFTSFRRTAVGTSDHVITRTYTYSDNSFPIHGSGYEEFSSTQNVNYSIKYIYY